MKKEKLNLNQKTFKALSNSNNGEVGDDTYFYYSQDEDTIWADYNGGEIAKGHLMGKQLQSGEFDFVYHHINNSGQIKIGKCLSKAILLDDGRVKLSEKWQWLSDDMSSGTSELIEVKKR